MTTVVLSLVLYESIALLLDKKLLEIENFVQIFMFVSLFIDVGGTPPLHDSMINKIFHLNINSQIGSCMPLAAMRIGTMIHNIEMNPG